MTTLMNEMMDAIVIETQRLPTDMLKYYRNPPGRKPSEGVLKIRSLLADMDDDTALLLIRDVVDSAVFTMVHLLGVGFKCDLSIDLNREGNRERLDDSGLTEDYRLRVDPGGISYKEE